jgi:UPF0716 protein FxsA
LWALFLLFIAVPLAELYVILQVAELLGGGVSGALWTIGLLALDSVLGALLLRSQGRAVWRRFNRALSERRMPHREVIDGVLVIVGGALLLTPGFLSDIVGVLMLAPPSRAAIRKLLIRRLGGRIAVGVAGQTARARRDFDVEGSASEYRPRPPGRLEP